MNKCDNCNKYIYFGHICLKCLFSYPICKKCNMPYFFRIDHELCNICLFLNKYNNKYNISNEKKNM